MAGLDELELLLTDERLDEELDLVLDELLLNGLLDDELLNEPDEDDEVTEPCSKTVNRFSFQTVEAMKSS